MTRSDGRRAPARTERDDGSPYGPEHRTLRRLELNALHRSGPRPCRRCGFLMDARRPDELDLGHVVAVMDGATGARAVRTLEHRACNRRAGAIAGNARRRPVDEPVQLALELDL